MKDARAASPIVQRSYLAPSYATAKARQAEALDVLAEILGGGTQSRLYRKLVIEQKLAAYIGAWYSGDAVDYGSFGVYGAPNAGIDLDKVEQAIDEVIADVVKSGVTQGELDRARAKLLADNVYALDNQATLARIFGSALATGSTVADVLGWDAEIEKLKATDIGMAAVQVLKIEASVTGRLIPEPPQSQK
jgi:zinc protease